MTPTPSHRESPLARLFSEIFIERDCLDHARTKGIIAKLSDVPVHPIENVRDYFGRYKKPYLHKRTDTKLFIGMNRGALVKSAPPAYGTKGSAHYYFVHQYNCIYECTYCYLQGYFQTPDIVMYVNHDDIIRDVERVAADELNRSREVWFHAGEFSDSLALAGLTNEWPEYWHAFAKMPQARLELRTKSANIRPLLSLLPLSNITVSFSVGSAMQIQQHDLRTPPLAARIRAMKSLAERGFRIGLHFDPIIDAPDWDEGFAQACRDIAHDVPMTSIDYVSIGVIRFAKKVLHQVKNNYPDSSIHGRRFVIGFDGKARYNLPLRTSILRRAELHLQNAGFPSELIYRCMEQEDDLATVSGCANTVTEESLDRLRI